MIRITHDSGSGSTYVSPMPLHLSRYRPSLPAALLLSGALFVSAAGGAVAGSQITGAQIKNGTVTAKDLSGPTKKSLRGLTSFSTVTKVSSSVPDGDFQFVTATCPSGASVLGSIAFWNNQHTVVESYSLSDDAVTAYGENNDGAADYFTLRITCARTD